MQFGWIFAYFKQKRFCLFYGELFIKGCSAYALTMHTNSFQTVRRDARSVFFIFQGCRKKLKPVDRVLLLSSKKEHKVHFCNFLSKKGFKKRIHPKYDEYKCYEKGDSNFFLRKNGFQQKHEVITKNLCLQKGCATEMITEIG